jgi:GT2 family glycosyltransferase
MNPKITIVILNWNGYEDTSECIISLQKITYDNYQIVVVDNGSDDEEFNKLKNNFPLIQVLRSDDNLGFTGGNNLGIKYSLEEKADYILLLNNDTIVEPNFIQPLLNVFEEDKNAGIVAPQINYFYEPRKIWTEGGKISRLRGSGFAYSDQIESNIKPYNKEVTFVSGCCMLIKKEVFEKIGLFDENYFLYVEDADLCYRTTHAGYKIIVTHSSKIHHKVSSSTKEYLSLLPLYYVTRNRLYFAKKNFPNFFIITVLYIVFSMSIKSIYWIFSNNSKNILIIINAFKDYFSKRMGKSSLLSFK